MKKGKTKANQKKALRDQVEALVGSRPENIATVSEQVDAMEQHVRFETLLAEISTLFINLPADRIDSEIENAQRRICKFLDLDRSSLFHADEGDPETLLLTHVYQPAGSRMPSEQMSVKEFFPWALQKILGGETITISKMTDLPAEAGRDRETFGRYGTKSVVVAPLSVGRRGVFGLLTFAVMREEREWRETVVQQFKLVTQIFANALARRQSERSLRESEARLSVATDAAGAGLWSMEPETGRVWVTPKSRELFRFSPDEDITYESYFKVIHPEDRDRVQQEVERALRSGETLYCDFRIALPDGDIRWICARGQGNLRSAGESGRFLGVSFDITERVKMEEALRERLGFETLLTEISTSFVNKPAELVDSEIEVAQRRICELLEIDLAAIWQRSDEDPDSFTLTHFFIAQEDLQPPERTKMIEAFPWYLQQMQAGRTVAVSSLEELPAEAARDRESGRLLGIKSNLTIPLSVGSQPPVGILGLNTLRAERDWPDALVRGLQLVAQNFANALARKHADVALRERLQFEGLLSGLSARFVNMPAGQVDSEIEDGLKQILEFFQVDRCALFRLLRDKTSWQITHIANSDNIPPVPKGVELPSSLYPWVYEKLADKHEVLSISRLDDLPAEAYIDRQTCIEWGIRSFVNIPILIGESVEHIININSVKRERGWPEELLPRLRLVGEIFVNALERKRAEDASRESEKILRQKESDLRGLTGRLICAQEEERSRLARELHDDLAQRLAAFAIDVGQLEKQLMESPAPVREALLEMKHGIIGISEDVHNLSRQLHPSILDDLGLIKAVESCAGFSKREGVEVVFNHENIPRVIPKDVSVALYRIIQEGLRNISKHACAEHTSVSLQGIAHGVLLSVQDDGIGFDWEEVKENSSLGFSSMRERTRLIHGELSIETQPEKGTVITVRAPLTREGG